MFIPKVKRVYGQKWKITGFSAESHNLTYSR